MCFGLRAYFKSSKEKTRQEIIIFVSHYKPPGLTYTPFLGLLIHRLLFSVGGLHAQNVNESFYLRRIVKTFNLAFVEDTEPMWVGEASEHALLAEMVDHLREFLTFTTDFCWRKVGTDSPSLIGVVCFLAA